MKDIKHIRRDFHRVPLVIPKCLGIGVLGGQKFNFLNMVMWHIKLKGMNSSPGYTEKIYSTKKKKKKKKKKKGSITIIFLRERGANRTMARLNREVVVLDHLDNR